MSIQENKAILNRIWEEIFNEGRLGIIDELYAPDYVYHGPGGHEIKGTEQLKRFVTRLCTSFHNIHFTVDELVAEGDKVVSVWTMRGIYKGKRQVTAPGIIVSRIVDGKVSEDLEMYDRVTIAAQAAPNWIAKGLVNSIVKKW